VTVRIRNIHMNECSHEHTFEASTRCFSGPVSSDENKAAHGCVCITVECRDCGTRREENRNWLHVERGPWGPSRDERRDEVERLRRRLPPLPPTVTLTRGDGETATLAPDREGMLRISSSEGVSQREQDSLGGLYPHLDALVARRLAVAALQAKERTV